MDTAEFKKEIIELKKMALKENTVYMCSEAVWWSCHRSLVSDYLKIRDWNVMHIMDIGKATEHPYTTAVSIVNGKLHYDEAELF